MKSKNEIVARVNGRPINRFDLDNAIQGYAMEVHRKTMDQLTDEELQAALDFALEKLLARELIFQEALAKGVIADEQAISAEKQKIIANFPSEEEFYATLAKGGITPEDYHRMLRQDVTVNLASEAKLREVTDPDEVAISRTYREHPEKMVRSGRVRASHILVRTDDKDPAAAAKLIGELQQRAADEDFAALAKQYSQCPSATGGGDLGYFRRGDMVKEFEAVTFNAEIGTVAGPVQTQFGIHLVKVLDKEDDVALTLEEARPKIIQFLRNEQGAKLLQGWVESLREQATIEFMLDA
ncbi:MAG TPA: peptidylprolyl isomerase [Geothermobacteraceae bacterium]|nr:peptidylprolyl isomerase [Geothermobacteraceae bacterium]